MSTYRKIQLALGTILLWSSTSVSSFAATNTITPGKNQSDTVKISVESIPSKQLNLTPHTNLIAQVDMLRILYQAGAGNFISQFEEAWKQSDRKQRLLTFCNSAPLGKSAFDCYRYLKIWLMDKQEKYFKSDMNPRDPGLEGNDVYDLMTAKPPSK